MNNAEIFRDFLEVCQTWDEFNEMLEVALEECFSADLVMAKTGRIWLYFRDGSDCFVNVPKGE
jgi:hypothetical protein